MTTEIKRRGPDVAKRLQLDRVADALLELLACRGNADKLRKFAKSVPPEHDHFASFPRKRVPQGGRFPRKVNDSFLAERMQEFESHIRETGPKVDRAMRADTTVLDSAYNMVCMALFVENEIKEREQIAKVLNKVATVAERGRAEIEDITAKSRDNREDAGTHHRQHLRTTVAPAQILLSEVRKLREVARVLTGPHGKMPFPRARLLKSLELALAKSGIQPQHAAVVLAPTATAARKSAKNRYKKRRKTIRRAG